MPPSFPARRPSVLSHRRPARPTWTSRTTCGFVRTETRVILLSFVQFPWMTVPSEVRSRKEKHACDQERQGDDSPLALPRTADAVLQLRHWLHVRLLAVGEQPLLVLSESDEVGVLLQIGRANV